MQEDIIPVEIVGLSTSATSGGAFVLVLGEIGGNRKLPVVVGENEATAIVIGIEKKRPPRPMSHDLLCDLMEYAQIEVQDILIDAIDEGTFFAKIRFDQNGHQGMIDARPSDAVAIAVRLDVEILVAESVLDEASIVAGEEDQPITHTPKQTHSPIEKLELKLERAIEEENYEEAARVRDELAKLKI
ncbi:MAG: bifunctional nuclease family protein [Bacteroidetes bacterium]|nr:bifunctional nuclease family protein [Bacteroidota bacterium]MCY4225793.1 bifunctional nuclease family protein [Bacteroidota bacterium]